MKQGIFLRAMAEQAKEAIIDIVGVIGWDVGYQQMRDILKQVPADCETVYFDIYSPGGDVWEGNGIVQDIGSMKQKTVARVQVAASMATLIAVACKEREMASNGRWLIHNPWTAVMGDAENLEKRAKELRDCEVEAAQFYASRTGKTEKEMQTLMSEERWLTAEETKELGFVQKVNDPFNPEEFKKVQEEIVAAGKWPKALIALPETDTKTEETKEEVADGNANTEGSKVVEVVVPVESSKPADAPEVKPIRTYEQGLAEAEQERTKLISEVSKFDALQKKFQSEKDSAIAAHKKDVETIKAEHVVALESQKTNLTKTINDLTESLKVANDKLVKMQGGGLTFAQEFNSWEEVMKSPGHVYDRDAKAYPELVKKYNETHKQRR